VTADGQVAPHLVLASAEAVLDLLVALLNPVAHTVEPNDLSQVGILEVGGQIPGGVLGQGGRIGGHHHCPLSAVRPVVGLRRLGEHLNT
jgi:hypothetical protein